MLCHPFSMNVSFFFCFTLVVTIILVHSGATHHSHESFDSSVFNVECLRKGSASHRKLSVTETKQTKTKSTREKKLYSLRLYVWSHATVAWIIYAREKINKQIAVAAEIPRKRVKINAVNMPQNEFILYARHGFGVHSLKKRQRDMWFVISTVIASKFTIVAHTFFFVCAVDHLALKWVEIKILAD